MIQVLHQFIVNQFSQRHGVEISTVDTLPKIKENREERYMKDIG